MSEERRNTIAGMVAMLVAAGAFAFMDAGLKLLTVHYSAPQVAALRGWASLPLVFTWALIAGGLSQLWRIRWPLHLLRGVLGVGMMISFAYALKTLSLARAYSLFFIAPLLIALLSSVMLGERVRRAQWIAICVGFTGVLIVLKPETSGFGWLGSIAVLGTAFCYAIVSNLVKIIGRTDSTQSMMFWLTAMMALGATALSAPHWRPVLEEHFLIIGGVAISGAVGQWGVTEAFKRAPAASVAPLEYSGLAWVVGIDFVIWSVVPGWRMLAGAAVIIASGLFLLRSEARRATQVTA